MIKVIKRIKPNIYDELTIAKLNNDKEGYFKILNNNKQQIYENYEIDIPKDFIIKNSQAIDSVKTLINRGLEESEEGIYAGIAEGSLYEFDFIDQSVTISVNLRDTYVFLLEHKRVWFSSNLYKGSFIFADYGTGEIIYNFSNENDRIKFYELFKYKEAIKDILNCSDTLSLDDLFKYYIDKD